MTGEWHKYSRCQMLVEHHEPWTHPMSDTKSRCKRQAVTYRLISSGKGVYVCHQHAMKIAYRMNSDFFLTPDNFFYFEEE